jgi:hypothetical protein
MAPDPALALRAEPQEGLVGSRFDPGGRTMRFAYADPPYLGKSKFNAAHHYGALHADAADCDTPEWHHHLIERLCDEFPDGWAMSLSSPSLRIILPMCPEDVRVGAWVKPFASFKRGVTRAYAWEPVILRGGRPIPTSQPTVRDWVSANITLRKGFPGAKPEAFSRWVFAWLNMLPTDDLVDMFPGSGAVTDALSAWRGEPTFSDSTITEFSPLHSEDNTK